MIDVKISERIAKFTLIFCMSLVCSIVLLMLLSKYSFYHFNIILLVTFALFIIFALSLYEIFKRIIFPRLSSKQIFAWAVVAVFFAQGVGTNFTLGDKLLIQNDVARYRRFSFSFNVPDGYITLLNKKNEFNDFFWIAKNNNSFLLLGAWTSKNYSTEALEFSFVKYLNDSAGQIRQSSSTTMSKNFNKLTYEFIDHKKKLLVVYVIKNGAYVWALGEVRSISNNALIIDIMRKQMFN